MENSNNCQSKDRHEHHHDEHHHHDDEHCHKHDEGHCHNDEHHHSDHHHHGHNADGHSHGHGHHHHHHHADTSSMSTMKLFWVTLLNLSITIFQVVGGVISNSLSLLSDAAHNLGDSSAIFIAFLAGKRAQKASDERRTFGYRRIEILAALFNSVVLIAICIYLIYEAYERFFSSEVIEGKTMIFVAIFGLLANLISVLVLQKDKEGNLNVKAAYLHLLGDTLSSVAVIAGSIAIIFWQIYWIDPVISILVSLYLIKHTWSVVRQTVDILMQSTPEGIDVKEVKKHVEKVPEVENIHHLHIWKLDDTRIFMEAHISLKEDILISKTREIEDKIHHILEKFNISHITLQFGYKCCNGDTDLISNY